MNSMTKLTLTDKPMKISELEKLIVTFGAVAIMFSSKIILIVLTALLLSILTLMEQTGFKTMQIKMMYRMVFSN